MCGNVSGVPVLQPNEKKLLFYVTFTKQSY